MMLVRVVAVLLLAVVLLGALFYSQWESPGFQVSGFIEADEIRVGSLVGGRVQKVHAVEGRTVGGDGLLLELEPFDLLARRAEAAAHLAERQAEYERVKAGFRVEEIAQAEARVAQLAAELTRLENGPRPEEIEVALKEMQEAEARVKLATLEYERIETLFGRGSVTQDDLDEAETAVKTARATWQARQAQYELLRKGTRAEEIAQARAALAEAEAALNLVQNGSRPEDIEEARAAVEAAQANLEAVEEQIEELKVYGPQGTVVQAVDLEPGDLVAPNAPVISLLNLSRLWVRAYVPEDRLAIRVGDRVAIQVDSYPDESFAGHISFIADRAEFTPRNVQTQDERAKQVFRIKVDIDEGLNRLRPGMAADVVFEPKVESDGQ